MGARSLVIAQGFGLLAGAGYLSRQGQLFFACAVALLGMGLTSVLHKLHLNYWGHFEAVLAPVISLEEGLRQRPWTVYKDQRTSLKDSFRNRWLVVHGPYLLLYIAFAIVAGFQFFLPTARNQVQAGDLQAQVMQVEHAFARTMAERDHAAFSTFLAEEAVFLEGTTVRRGKQAVAAHWQTYFAAPEAPFSWVPETVSVQASGKLAISTGPVWNGEGRRISTFTSIWRQEEPGVWRIIFDKGDKYCE